MVRSNVISDERGPHLGTLKYLQAQDIAIRYVITRVFVYVLAHHFVYTRCQHIANSKTRHFVDTVRAGENVRSGHERGLIMVVFVLDLFRHPDRIGITNPGAIDLPQRHQPLAGGNTHRQREENTFLTIRTAEQREPGSGGHQLVGAHQIGRHLELEHGQSKCYRCCATMCQSP